MIHDHKIVLEPQPQPNSTVADEFCQQKGGYLAAPENADEWIAITTAFVDDTEGEPT